MFEFVSNYADQIDNLRLASMVVVILSAVAIVANVLLSYLDKTVKFRTWLLISPVVFGVILVILPSSQTTKMVRSGVKITEKSVNYAIEHREELLDKASVMKDKALSYKDIIKKKIDDKIDGETPKK